MLSPRLRTAITTCYTTKKGPPHEASLPPAVRVWDGLYGRDSDLLHPVWDVHTHGLLAEEWEVTCNVCNGLGWGLFIVPPVARPKGQPSRLGDGDGGDWTYSGPCWVCKPAPVRKITDAAKNLTVSPKEGA